MQPTHCLKLSSMAAVDTSLRQKEVIRLTHCGSVVEPVHSRANSAHGSLSNTKHRWARLPCDDKAGRACSCGTARWPFLSCCGVGPRIQDRTNEKAPSRTRNGSSVGAKVHVRLISAIYKRHKPYFMRSCWTAEVAQLSRRFAFSSCHDRYTTVPRQIRCLPFLERRDNV